MPILTDRSHVESKKRVNFKYMGNDLESQLFEKYAELANLSIFNVPEPERTLMLVYLAKYPLSNGGYRYLFERDLAGNVTHGMIIDAFGKIGMTDLAQSYKKVMTLFPHSVIPEDINQREIYLCKYFDEDLEDGDDNPSFSPLVEDAERIYFDVCQDIPSILEMYYKQKIA